MSRLFKLLEGVGEWLDDEGGWVRGRTEGNERDELNWPFSFFDASSSSFPVFFNEPTSMLQRMAEDMEYSECRELLKPLSSFFVRR